MKKLRWLFILPALLVLVATPAYAALPPASIAIDVKYINRNLIATGDQLYYAIYDINYATLPTGQNVDDLFVFRLVDTDGITELGSNEAYSFEDQGFGKGVISFYFPAATAPTWGLNYYIRVQGKPGFFATPPDQLFIINVGDYTASTTLAINQSELRDNVISMARVLETEWTPLTLLTEIETGTVLDTDGEEYFRNSINGIQSMCPQLFSTQIVDVTYEDRAWNTTQQTTYEGRTAGTSIGTGIQGLSDVFSLDFNMIASLPILIACVLCVYASVKMKGKPESGLLCCMSLLILGGFMGWAPFALIAVASTICFLYIAMIIIGRIPS